MARIPLEDNFNDVINKTQRGMKITDADLASRAEVTLPELAAVKGGTVNALVIRRVARHLRLSPDALEALAHRSWYPEQPLFKRGFAMFNTPFEDMTVNSYLIWDSRTKEAAVFDTGANCDDMLSLIAAEKLRVSAIFLTHTHDDHIADLPKLVAATGATVWTSELETSDSPGSQTFKENAHFHFGELSVKTLLTFGHSPGMTSYVVDGLSWPLAIVGDSIFSCSMGGSPTHFREQYENNRTKLMTLYRDTVFACGHGPLTTLTQERLHNPYFAR
ncbi:MAG: MBL fold metallo-hydrolase [Opitutaceae bacterium]|jgi:glyoxylase-like metal-dependent hydrolase (beta-lactamase superfamily II)|nr:MBL fold metallo-hydrolase [Opitutaceae bacterium]